MNQNIEKNFNNILINIVDKRKKTSILTAISGGQDSICLIKLIENLKKKLILLGNENKINIEYIYIDHQWKKDSTKQIQHIISYLKSLKQVIKIYQIKDLALSENSCRKYRYHTIIQHAIKYKQNIIITAHTETDKIETFFQNVLRGAGIEGVTSLRLARKLNKDIYIIRPLINIKRDNTYYLCKKHYLPIWSDITNYNYNIQRNRVRNELIPYLRQYFNNNVENNLKYLIKYYHYDNEYIKQNTIKFYISSIHEKFIAINYKKVNKQHFALQIRVIQLFYFHNFNRYLNKNQLLELIKIINKFKLNLNIKYKNFYLNTISRWIYIKLK
uniref:tRNA(Ile)-lysidine synthase, chloroplastic n=1 Tax=Dasyclonium flaccidum TaxID=2007274 RepID=A0A1Z1MKF0_9FLOR|nr:tRNA Ile-lysidine synthetase [Dasyclonium flaccidum]ARW66570.1 tRNA Ile-lysidine synthetase [Dasyclonium flaccidum]